MGQRVSEAEKRKQILDRSRAIFMARGVSALSMDQIASLQGISKKTLYKFFPNKAALTEEAIETRIREVATSVDRIAADSALSFLARLQGIFDIVSRQISELGESFVRDVSYHEPEIWERIDKFRREHVFEIITRLLKEGIREGHIRDDIDGRLVPVLFTSILSSVMTPAQFVRLPFPPAELFDTFIRILFGGVLTEKARRQFFSREGRP
ncbi:MAG: TetR/AcrR family transcriptional regulator [Spirochaetia bacterium]